MANFCIRLPEQTYHNARVWAALHRTTVTETVRLFLEMLPGLSAAKIGIPSARSATARAARAAAARAVLSARPAVTLRFSDEDPAPARSPRPAP